MMSSLKNSTYDFLLTKTNPVSSLEFFQIKHKGAKEHKVEFIFNKKQQQNELVYRAVLLFQCYTFNIFFMEYKHAMSLSASSRSVKTKINDWKAVEKNKHSSN